MTDRYRDRTEVYMRWMEGCESIEERQFMHEACLGSFQYHMAAVHDEARYLWSVIARDAGIFMAVVGIGTVVGAAVLSWLT